MFVYNVHITRFLFKHTNYFAKFTSRDDCSIQNTPHQNDYQKWRSVNANQELLMKCDKALNFKYHYSCATLRVWELMRAIIDDSDAFVLAHNLNGSGVIWSSLHSSSCHQTVVRELACPAVINTSGYINIQYRN